MAIPRRLTEQRRVVSRFDPSWQPIVSSHATAQKYADYCNTLDIGIIGDPLAGDEPFTVFDVAPLQVQYESFVAGDNSNWWAIFKSHVKSISGMRLSFSGSELHDKHRGEIGLAYVEDIARMIVEMANIDGESVFFSMPGGCWAFVQNCRRRHASEMEQAVRSMAAAIDSGPQSQTAPPTD